jgi:hypothetical protein
MMEPRFLSQRTTFLSVAKFRGEMRSWDYMELYNHSQLYIFWLPCLNKKKNSVALVRKQTIPTERPPHVGGVNANFCGQRVSRGQRNWSPWPFISVI